MPIEQTHQEPPRVAGAKYMPDDKWNLSDTDARERYGVEATPIPADEAWVAPIENFSQKDVKAEKWILINLKANKGEGTMSFVNTFDGHLGQNFKQDVATFPYDASKFRHDVVGHIKMPIEQCPVAVTPQDAAAHGKPTERRATSLVHEATAEQEQAMSEGPITGNPQAGTKIPGTQIPGQQVSPKGGPIGQTT